MNPYEEAVIRETRRQFFSRTARGLGVAALASMFGFDERLHASGPAPDKYIGGLSNLPHFAPKAKRAVYMHMLGGPPQQDLFDYKPGLKDWYDKDLPDSIRQGQRLTTMSSGQARFPVAPSIYKFSQHGQSGAWVSELLPYTAKMVDDIAIVRVPAHRADQSRAGDYLHADRLDDRRQAVHRIVAGLRPRQHVRGSADVRRHERRSQQHADADPGDVGQDVERGISAGEVFGRVAACGRRARSVHQQSRRRVAGSPPADARRAERAQRAAAPGHRRSRNADAHRAVRDGVSHADVACRS